MCGCGQHIMMLGVFHVHGNCRCIIMLLNVRFVNLLYTSRQLPTSCQCASKKGKNDTISCIGKDILKKIFAANI